MNDDCRKRLTEFLGECDMEGMWWCGTCIRYIPSQEVTYDECHDDRMGGCGYNVTPEKNRTFTTEQDMMALYRRLVITGGWDKFTLIAAEIWRAETSADYEPRNIRKDFTSWLFCLSGEGYEDRCRMVAEFLEGSHD